MTDETLSNVALLYAIKEIGKEEIPKGSNWGENVQKYLSSVGITFPASWCMAFVHWCVDQAALNLNIHNPLFRSGGVLDTWNHTPINLRTTKPQAGDIFILDFKNGHGHTGFVKSVDTITIQTVEGNSNESGSAEGYEVCSKPGGRLITHCKGFISLK